MEDYKKLLNDTVADLNAVLGGLRRNSKVNRAEITQISGVIARLQDVLRKQHIQATRERMAKHKAGESYGG